MWNVNIDILFDFVLFEINVLDASDVHVSQLTSDKVIAVHEESEIVTIEEWKFRLIAIS